MAGSTSTGAVMTAVTGDAVTTGGADVTGGGVIPEVAGGDSNDGETGNDEMSFAWPRTSAGCPRIGEAGVEDRPSVEGSGPCVDVLMLGPLYG